MDRMEMMGGFPLHDRFIHFHRVASYWTAVLDRFQPDALVMPSAPHVVYDYVAYAIAKRRGIRTIMFEYVTTEGLLMAIDAFEDGLPPLIAAYRKLLENPPTGPVVLSDRLERYWRRLRGSHDQAMPAFTRKLLTAEAARLAEEEQKKKKRAEMETKRLADEEAKRFAEAEAKRANPILHRLRSALAQLPGKSAKSSSTSEPLPPAPAPPRPPETDGYHGGRFYAGPEVPDDLARAAAEYRRQHIETLRRRYDELAVVPDLNQPYVYVALHLQPERTSNPGGGVFDDQDALIGLIASVLPAGWRIYVKEHPAQLIPQFVSERGRWPTLYDAILVHPGVFLVPRATPSFDLIDRARAVATISGTSSWEAIVRGVPTLIFGEAWYKGCPGAYTIRNIDDCRQALSRIAGSERPDPEAVRLFLRAAEDSSFPGYLTMDEAELVGTELKANVANLARAIVDRYSESYAPV
jgi:hypothetical protein